MRAGRRPPQPPVVRDPVADETKARPSAVLALQRAAGNRATTRLLQRRTTKGYGSMQLGRNRAGR